MRSAAALLLLAACGEAPTYVLLQVPEASDAGIQLGQDSGPRPQPDAGIDGGIDAGPTLRVDGQACTVDRQCEGGACIRDPAFRGGYCTFLDCLSNAQCRRPSGQCVESQNLVFCAGPCDARGRCRAGYQCAPVGNEQVCLPTDLTTDREDGEACNSDGQCRGGTCLSAPDFPEGYCTTTNCFNDTSCANHRGADNRCRGAEGGGNSTSLCLRHCTAFSDCRRGYVCSYGSDGDGSCLPDGTEVVSIPSTAAGLICAPNVNGVIRFGYTIPPGTRSYLATPFAQDGRQVAAHHLELPSGRRVDFHGDHAFQGGGASIHGFLAPTLIPATLNWQADLEIGPHIYEVESRSDDACLWLTTEAVDGDAIDLRIYLTGLFGFQAATAPNDPVFQAWRAEMDNIYGQVGLHLGSVTFRDIPEPAATTHRFVDSFEEMFALMALSEPIPANRDQRVVNLFFVQGFGADLPVFGIASGLPGPVGLHGTSASGVVATAELLGQVLQGPEGEVDGTLLTANVTAHEIGHYLSLHHTTETDLVHFDPVLDTPTCRQDQFPDLCPDLNNLMFPFADPNGRTLTPGQGFSLRAHPLTKE